MNKTRFFIVNSKNKYTLSIRGRFGFLLDLVLIAQYLGE